MESRRELIRSLLILFLLIFEAGCSPSLHTAIKKGDIIKAKTMISQKPEQVSEVYGHWNPLMLAIRYKQPEIVELLLEAGVDINEGNKSGYTPIHVACNYRTPEIQSLLIDNGVKINVKDWRGLTPLMIAVLNNNLKLTELLIEKGADVNAIYTSDNPQYEDYDTYETALHYAAMNENMDIVECLVNSEDNVDHQNKKLQTPLFISILNKDSMMSQFLVNSGADVNLHNEQMQSPLYVSCATNQNELAKILIRSGAVVIELEGNADEMYYTAISYRMLADYLTEKEILNEAKKSYLNAADFFEKAKPLLISKSKYYKRQKNMEKILVGMETAADALTSYAVMQGKLSPYEQERLYTKARDTDLTVEELAFLEEDYANRANLCQEASLECRQKAKQIAD